MKKLISILLDFGSYVPYNAKIAKALGSPESAILLSVLMNRFNFYSENGKIDMEGFFYCTAETLESISAIGGRPQETAIKCLVNNKLIIKKVKGLPAKTHYKFPENLETCLDDLLNKFAQNEETCKSEKNKLDSAKCWTNDNINNDKEKDINNIEGEKTPPTNESEITSFNALENEYDGVPFSGDGMVDFLKWQREKQKAEIENKANNLPLEEKKEKEKNSAKKEKKEKPQLKTMIESYPDEESFVSAWGLRFGAKYPKVDASKGYNRILLYCETSGKLYADYVRVLFVWYTGESENKRKSYEYDERTKQSNYDILANMVANMDNSNSDVF